LELADEPRDEIERDLRERTAKAQHRLADVGPTVQLQGLTEGQVMSTKMSTPMVKRFFKIISKRVYRIDTKVSKAEWLTGCPDPETSMVACFTGYVSRPWGPRNPGERVSAGGGPKTGLPGKLPLAIDGT
jgi:hypothetical protein